MERLLVDFTLNFVSLEQFNTINDRLYDAGWKAQFVSGKGGYRVACDS